MLKHNKKRNIGLLNEFFAQYIANAVVEFRYDDVEKAKELWRKHVVNNKELSEELKVFEMLNKTYIRDTSVANDLVKKAQTVISEQDHKKVERAKTNLLHEVNRQLKDENFFNRQVDRDRYQTNANIQMLINSWRSPEDKTVFSDAGIFRIKDQVVEHITTRKEELPPLDASLLNNTKEDIDQLVVNVFKEKIDKKYSDLLNEDQKRLIGWFVFAKERNEARAQLANMLKELRDNTLMGIEEELKAENKKTPVKKLTEVRQYLKEDHYDIENPNDETISFYLAVCGLKHELETK